MVSLLTGLGARQVTGREKFWLSGKDETPKASQPEGSLPLLHSVPLTVERGTGWERVQLAHCVNGAADILICCVLIERHYWFCG